jgi:hypothetical protein
MGCSREARGQALIDEIPGPRSGRHAGRKVTAAGASSVHINRKSFTGAEQITVSPVEGGWAVAIQSIEPLLFKSGAQAEACARRLCESLALIGRPRRLRIVLPDGHVAGTFICEAERSIARWRRID